MIRVALSLTDTELVLETAVSVGSLLEGAGGHGHREFADASLE